jgi:hypothetical protein
VQGDQNEHEATMIPQNNESFKHWGAITIKGTTCHKVKVLTKDYCGHMSFHQKKHQFATTKSLQPIIIIIVPLVV